jgi:hypothetical protein
MASERRRPKLAELIAQRRVRRQKLIRQIKQLRAQGKTWREIATKMGLSAQRCWDLFRRYGSG